MDKRLRPCPFCGGGDTEINEIPLTRGPRMDGKPSPIISVEIRHWCKHRDGLSTASIVFRARDRETALATWNRTT